MDRTRTLAMVEEGQDVKRRSPANSIRRGRLWLNLILDLRLAYIFYSSPANSIRRARLWLNPILDLRLAYILYSSPANSIRRARLWPNPILDLRLAYILYSSPAHSIRRAIIRLKPTLDLRPAYIIIILYYSPANSTGILEQGLAEAKPQKPRCCNAFWGICSALWPSF
ncbi:hypothetical protein PoB_004622600 [Plakobranchus ocellatus]|uniref:Uncharacterized protein n=1 Tax=Plakobranchus ocellatus TaxID=259542 RepID=A0AAV4B8L9_9GAST|nr:hypothetical protein PoB_004622600 [Plakobranchus ocellatus]